MFRFADWASEKSFSEERHYTGDGLYEQRIKPTVSAVVDGIRRGFESGSERIKSLKSLNPYVKGSSKKSDSGKKVLDPQGPFLQLWNKIFLLSCVLAVSIDPLFFYIPVVDRTRHCLDLDTTLEILACVFRSFFDAFYILHIVFQFRTGFIPASSRVFGRGELVGDRSAISRRYFRSYFFVDLLAILPLPQVYFIHLDSTNSFCSFLLSEK